MPTPDEILTSLSAIAQAHTRYAVMWHILFVILIFALILRWKPENRFLSTFMALPLVSVSVFAWLGKNPVNGSIFAIFAILLIILGLRNTRAAIRFASPFWSATGLVFIIFGLIYPHFTDPDSFIGYLYASPAGLLPCPTLITVTGFAILLNGFGSRPWSITLFIIGLFYGMLGFFWLDVYLDIALILASLMLLVQALTTRMPHKSDPLA